MVAVGCGSTTAPDSPPPPTFARAAGTYALAAVAGRPVPTLYGTGQGITSTLAADTVTFAADSTWRRVTAYSTTVRPEVRDTYTSVGTWTFDSASATAQTTLRVPHGALVITTYHVSTRADGMSLDVSCPPNEPYAYGCGVWSYTRVQ